ncbi:MAG: fumarate hydratase [Desulfovermiculus sp.]
MISRKTVESVLYDVITRASCSLPHDVEKSFERAIQTETSKISQRAFGATLESLKKCRQGEVPACPDTGWPLFFITMGNEVQIEGGVSALEEEARAMVAKATLEGTLRKTMKHPLTGEDPGTNVGMNMPCFSYQFIPGQSLQITFVAKGGGSECFGGSRLRIIAFADGKVGIKKAVIDWYIAAARAGAICPPSVLGVGIGGTTDVCMHLAKKAATLRMIGSQHPEPLIADLENELYTEINNLGIGAMGLGGDVSIFAVHIEYSLTHLAGIAVGMSANCWITRRASTKIYADGSTQRLENTHWFEGR